MGEDVKAVFFGVLAFFGAAIMAGLVGGLAWVYNFLRANHISAVWVIVAGFVVYWLVGGVIAWVRRAQGEGRGALRVEAAHLVRRKADGYPMHVNDEQLARALRTGAYELVSRYDPQAGGFDYSDDRGDIGVPVGFKVAYAAGKTDERLNHDDEDWLAVMAALRRNQEELDKLIENS